MYDRKIVFLKGTRVAVSITNADKNDGRQYVCEDGHDVFVKAGENIKAKHFCHNAGEGHDHQHGKRALGGEGVLHQLAKEFLASKFGGIIECKYPDSSLVADVGAPDLKHYHEVVVHHPLGRDKAKTLREMLGSSKVRSVYVYDLRMDDPALMEKAINDSVFLEQILKSKRKSILPIGVEHKDHSINTGKSIEGVKACKSDAYDSDLIDDVFGKNQCGSCFYWKADTSWKTTGFGSCTNKEPWLGLPGRTTCDINQWKLMS